MNLRAETAVAADSAVEAGLQLAVTTVEAGVTRAVVVELEVVAATASRARLVPAPVVCVVQHKDVRVYRGIQVQYCT